jgi:Icc protein
MMDRRRFLGTSVLAGLAAQAFAAPAEPESFDFAFLTDIHVQPELGAPEGFRQCLRAVNRLATPADFVLTGGDLIFDALDVGMDRIREQWKVFDECSKELALPVHHTIGNHDVVGWSARSLVKPTDQDYGKKLFAERFGLERTYRSFDHKGWHFIILDSIGQDKETLDYEGWIDDAQLAWLKQDLAATGRAKPIVMVTHIPFYTTWHQVLKGPDHRLDGKAIVRNLHTFRKLFDDYNLQLVLSGHGHVVERIEIGKVTYLQGGAVSGMWWKGPVFGKPEGFGTVTCRRDGTWSWKYRDYGWKARR